VVGNEHQSESAAHAVADDADPAIAARLGGKPGTGGFDVVEGGPAAGSKVTHDGPRAEK
jgi:hypothetical protein